MKQSRNTLAKTEIVKILKSTHKAFSHSEIQAELDGLCDRVTIYRVLDRLILEGIIHKLSTIDGEVKYAACHSCSNTNHHHNHLHFSCNSCHSITCMEEIEPQFSLPKEYKIKDVNFTISGICPNCITKEDELIKI